MNRICQENRALVERLNESIKRDAVFHACIIVSRYREDREAFAKDYVKAVLSHRDIGDHSDRVICSKIDNGNHEDLIHLRREKKKANIAVDDIRKMQRRIAVKPFGKRHVVLVTDGDYMNDVGQNTLLKTLEEPPGETMIIILTEDQENLIPTVRSRCVIYTLEDEREADDEKIQAIAHEVMKLSVTGAPYYRLRKAIEPIEGSSDEVRVFIDMAEEICRDHLTSRDEKGMPYDRDKTGNDIYALENARKKLDRGLNTKYTVKELLLRIGG